MTNSYSMPTVGMVDDALMLYKETAVDGRTLTKQWLIVLLLTSASYSEKPMSEGHTQNIDFWK